MSSRWPRRTLITRVTLVCIANLGLFWLLQPGLLFENLPGAGVAFYLWVGMFGVFVVAQFWTFAADLYAGERGKRLLPLIAVGATGGAAFGSFLTQHLGGGQRGIRHVLAHLGPPMVDWWRSFETPAWTEELESAVVDGVDNELAGTDQEALVAERDAMLIDLVAAKRAARHLPS